MTFKTPRLCRNFLKNLRNFQYLKHGSILRSKKKRHFLPNTLFRLDAIYVATNSFNQAEKGQSMPKITNHMESSPHLLRLPLFPPRVHLEKKDSSEKFLKKLIFDVRYERIERYLMAKIVNLYLEKLHKNNLQKNPVKIKFKKSQMLHQYTIKQKAKNNDRKKNSQNKRKRRKTDFIKVTNKTTQFATTKLDLLSHKQTNQTHKRRPKSYFSTQKIIFLKSKNTPYLFNQNYNKQKDRTKRRYLPLLQSKHLRHQVTSQYPSQTFLYFISLITHTVVSRWLFRLRTPTIAHFLDRVFHTKDNIFKVLIVFYKKYFQKVFWGF